MADNYNINTTQGQANEALGLDNTNPAMTYVDFANQIAKNSATQQLQNNAVQQAQLMLQQKQQAAASGVNPETAGYLPVDEAVAELKAAGVDDDTIQEFVKGLGNQQMVNRASIDTIIRKKMLSSKMSVAGKSFKTTDDIAVPAGMKAEDMGLIPDPAKPGIGHVPSNGEYQVSVDPDSGQPMAYISLGETPPSNIPGATTPLQTAKRWSDLEKQLTQITKVGRGTALTQSLMRANRALNYLASHPNLDKTGLAYIQQDLTGIFQGGVPTEEEMRNTEYTTAIQEVNQLIGKYTGTFGALKWNATTAGDQSYVRDQLQSVLIDMRQSITNTLQSMITAMADGYQDIIQQNPERWQQMLTDQEKILDSGLNKSSSSLVTPIVPTESSTTTAPGAASTATSTSPASTSTPVTRKPLSAIFGQ
jgi:hypothetical protein